jgi:hypothetical protein
MTPDFHAHAKQRLISNAYPGWWVRTFKGSGTGDEEWLKVVSVQNYKSTEPDKRPFTKLLCVVNEETREGAEVVDYSNEYVLCCTKIEAKKAGVA